jgi:hypothetical protein
MTGRTRNIAVTESVSLLGDCCKKETLAAERVL